MHANRNHIHRVQLHYPRNRVLPSLSSRQMRKMSGLQEGTRDETRCLYRVGTLSFLPLQGLQKERRSQDENLGYEVVVGVVVTCEL